jgi:Carboxypeptidase regulatory-like domain
MSERRVILGSGAVAAFVAAIAAACSLNVSPDPSQLSLQGIVYDQSDNGPIYLANVTLAVTEGDSTRDVYYTQTDIQGQYAMTVQKPAGSLVIYASASGYVTSIKAPVDSSKNFLSYDFYLKPNGTTTGTQ